MISKTLRKGGRPVSKCPSKKNIEACTADTSCKWNAATSKCRKTRVSKKKILKMGDCDYCGGPLEDKIDLNIIDVNDGSSAVLCYKCNDDEQKVAYIMENGPRKQKKQKVSTTCPKKLQTDCQADQNCVWNSKLEKCRKKTVRAIPKRLQCKDITSMESCSMDIECLWNKKGKCQKRRQKKISAAPRVSPQRVSPQRVSPQRVSPQRVSPQRVSPQRVSPQRVSPQRVDPISLIFLPKIDSILKDCNFGNFANYSKEGTAIAQSGHGFITAFKYTSKYHQLDVVLKGSMDKTSDSLVYEYLVGQCINHFAQFFPFFSRTYQVCQYNTKKDFNTLKDATDKFTLSRGLDKMLSIIDTSNIDNLIKTGCRDKQLICLMTQYFNFEGSLKKCILNGMNANTLLTTLYMVYSCLTSLSRQLTHYDLHEENIQLTKIPNNGYTLIRMHLQNGSVVSFKTDYIPTIIDYGRCYVNCAAVNSTEIAKKVCFYDNTNPNKDERVCKKKCGNESGYELPNFNKKTQTFDPHQYADFIDISRSNMSTDLRLLNLLRFTFYGNNLLGNSYSGKNLTQFFKDLPLFSSTYVFPENLDMDPNRIRNIITAKNRFQAMIDNPSFIAENNANYSSKTYYNTVDIWEDLSRPFEVSV